MHNIDRTVGGANYEYNNGNYEMNPGGYGYQEAEGEYNEYGETEYGNEMSGEYQGEAGYSNNELNQEAYETELATELLEVSNEAELDQFLGKLVRRAAGAAKSFANSAAGQAIGGILKSAAKQALPIAAGALGTAIGGPAGGAIGSKLGSMASNLFELELEGLSNEDKEFELSRAYIRFANDAVRQAAFNPRFRAYPRQVTRNAVTAAARRFAPGLLRRRPVYVRPAVGSYDVTNVYNDNTGYDNAGSGQPQSGSWYKQGNQIILNL